LNWLISQGNVIPIPGAKNANQAKQNAGALGWSLTKEEIELLRKKSN
jgi:aryl-alcohol dehydrogenase-like predicted oxidoreductase